MREERREEREEGRGEREERREKREERREKRETRRAIDENENDMLSFDEFERVVRANGTQGGLSLKPSYVSLVALQGLWRALDEDSSGEVSIDEFMHFMRQTDKKEEKVVEEENPRVIAAREKAKERVDSRRKRKEAE